jgi:peptide/nickel transport system substrate-binding protein
MYTSQADTSQTRGTTRDQQWPGRGGNTLEQKDQWARLAARGLGRRRFVGAGVTLAGVAALAAACGGGSKENKGVSNAGGGGAAPTRTGAVATTAPDQQPKSGGDYRTGFTGPFAGVDPHNSVYGGAGIVPVVYDLLIRQSLLAPDKGIVQQLAVSQERAPDNVTWIFKLRPDAMIQENKLGVPVRPIDAEDVKASFDRIADPKAAANGFQFMKDWVDKVEAVDKTTVKFTTKQPFAFLTHSVGNNLIGAVVPREWLENADLKKNAVGSGPFILQSVEEGAQAVMARNPNYWDKGKPYVNTYTIKSFADQATYRTAFATNQVDVYGAFNIDEAKDLQKTRKDIQYIAGPTFAGLKSFWMNTRVPPWNDPRIRKAVRLAVNPQEYIQIIGHGQGVEIGPISYALKQYALPEDEVKKLMPYDPQQAKQLLQAAGQPNLTFKFQHPTSSNTGDYVNIFVRQMQAAGITAQAEPQDAGTWVAQYFQSKLTATLALNQEYTTPDTALRWWATKGIVGGGLYDTGFSDPEVDASITKAATILDDQERIKAYQDAQRLIISKDPAFWYFFGVLENILVSHDVVNYPAGLGAALGTAQIKDIWLNR